MNYVRLRFVDSIATVTLDRPHGNRIDFGMREELLRTIAAVAESNARALVIRAAGDDFCLGGDVRDWVGVRSSELRPRIEVYADALDRLDQLSIPSLAVVQGNCRGGGFELALSCDFILAADTATFAFPEAKLGILTLQGGMYLLAERVGYSKALEAVMLSTPLGTDSLCAWNVVNAKAPAEGLELAAAEMTQRLAAVPTAAYAATKQLLRIWRDEGRPAARAALYEISMPLFDSPNVQAALSRAAKAIG